MNPYENIPVEQWHEITRCLVEKHPLTPVIVDLCLKSWQSILHGKINTYLNMQINEMGISLQATGALPHDVIPVYISKNIEGFRKGIGNEKDIVCEYDDFYSLELKTSSQKSIYGNRSYTKSDSGKSKTGYYLTINFEKIQENEPKLLLIQMGWLNHSDWLGQKSETGQQAALTKEARDNKFIVLYK
ncbi:MAG: ScaI family restriction endonuclease [Spirochaetaceae bacterium]|jgi:hypothetical protein|nr:ScaI family restriction endonuclease [Spirochaetaceae bacterium]